METGAKPGVALPAGAVPVCRYARSWSIVVPPPLLPGSFPRRLGEARRALARRRFGTPRPPAAGARGLMADAAKRGAGGACPWLLPGARSSPRSRTSRRWPAPAGARECRVRSCNRFGDQCAPTRTTATVPAPRRRAPSPRRRAVQAGGSGRAGPHDQRRFAEQRGPAGRDAITHPRGVVSGRPSATSGGASPSTCRRRANGSQRPDMGPVS